MLTIRPETEKGHAAIYEVNLLAFGRDVEPRLVDALRHSADFIPELSLVAVSDAQVVGHILFSRMLIITRTDSVPALSLAPLAVRPAFQNQGIGSELVRRGLQECRWLGHKFVIVVGHPKYYPRFGSSSARAKGLDAPFPVSDEAFMALELVPGALDGITGLIKYSPAFDEFI